jgi:hypothetical protein
MAEAAAVCTESALLIGVVVAVDWPWFQATESLLPIKIQPEI